MRKITLVILACLGLAGACLAAGHVENLRCESLHEPLGIGEPQPRLSWIIESEQRGEIQTAYQVLVAGTPEALAADKGDLWDSGKVASDDTTAIVYAGPALTSGQACFWKVRVWDCAGKVSAWSAPALWTMGLLDPTDWHAKWIATAPASPAGTKLTILQASYEATDGQGSNDVTALLSKKVRRGSLVIVVGNDQLGGDPAHDHAKQLRVKYTLDGKTDEKTIPESDLLALPESAAALPFLRKAFMAAKPIRSATIYVTALGLYELHLNGQRVGDHVLAPDWTDYNKRVRYQAYDVTALLKPGANALGAILANGWYAGHIGNGGFQVWGTVPALLAQLEITYTDGTHERVVSDETWKQHASPLLASDFMLGEAYDARLEVSGWDQPGLDESQWNPVTVREEARHLDWQVSQPVRVTGEIQPKAITEPKPGRWTFDLGQNMVGVVRLKLNAPAGTQITVRHAEMLNTDGTIYVANLRGAPSIDHYICKGGGETWQPKFAFHGFRYVELTGLSEKPGTEAVTGIVLGSDTPAAGDFACSDPRVNQLQSNIQWGQRGNYLSVPTDCPQRDERLGWMGDAEVFVRTATGNADVQAFFSKWLVDVDDAQTPEGMFKDVSPSKNGWGGGVPAWGDAGVICPWTIYQAYGDKRILERHLPAMIKWVEWCRAHSTGLIRDKSLGGNYGDWLAIGANTPKDLIGTAYLAYSTHLVANACKVIGHDADAAKYQQLFEDIRAAFNQKFVAADGRIQGDTQCGYAMALKFELLPDELRSKAAQYLDEDIKAKGNHLSTGFVGVSYLLPVLTRAGKLDTAYNLLLQDTFPSWLFSVKHGATTIWERWDGWTPEKGFQNPGMNSFNHYSLGSCGEWLYDSVAGIGWDMDAPGYKHIIIRPQPGNKLSFARRNYDSIHGRIATSWKRDGHAFTLVVTVPANTTATVYVPAADALHVTESGRPAASAEGVKFLRQENGVASYEVGSGTYRFGSILNN